MKGNTMPELFSIRPAEERDLANMQAICTEHGLGVIETIEDCTVAVNDEDLTVGFIHIKTVDDESPDTNGAYVYPVAVFGEWQNHKVASTLIRHELDKAGELKLVACKPSQGFYPKLGFKPLAWEQIARQISHDCTVCANYEDCGPKAFIINQ